MTEDKKLKKAIELDSRREEIAADGTTSPERSIQSFYMIALKNHIKLSAIADTKANLLLSVNAILISLVLSNLASKLNEPQNEHLTIPVIILLTFSLVSVVISILVTRPNVTEGKFTEEDLKDNKVNLTFFGNFHAMEYKEYESAVKDMHTNNSYIYNSLTKDLYFLGDVLGKKYLWIKIAFTIFLVGLVFSAIAFGIAIKFFGPTFS